MSGIQIPVKDGFVSQIIQAAACHCKSGNFRNGLRHPVPLPGLQVQIGDDRFAGFPGKCEEPLPGGANLQHRRFCEVHPAGVLPALPIQAITLLFVHTVEVFLYICFHIAVGKVFWFLIGSCGIPMGKQRGCETEEQYQTGYSLKHHVPPWCCVLTADPTSAR